MDIKRRRFVFGTACLTTVSISGCLNDNNGNEVENVPQQNESDSNSIANEYIQIAESENPIQTAESFGINHDNNAVEAQITFVDENTDHMPDGITEINTMHENQAVGFINVNAHPETL